MRVWYSVTRVVSFLSLSSAGIVYRRKSTAVLSDRICSFVAIDDGSSEQYCRMDGKYREILVNKVYCERR